MEAISRALSRREAQFARAREEIAGIGLDEKLREEILGLSLRELRGVDQALVEFLPNLTNTA